MVYLLRPTFSSGIWRGARGGGKGEGGKPSRKIQSGASSDIIPKGARRVNKQHEPPSLREIEKWKRGMEMSKKRGKRRAIIFASGNQLTRARGDRLHSLVPDRLGT